MASAIFKTLLPQTVQLTGSCNRSDCSGPRHLPFKAILAIIDEKLLGFGFEAMRSGPLAKTADAGLRALNNKILKKFRFQIPVNKNIVKICPVKEVFYYRFFAIS